MSKKNRRLGNNNGTGSSVNSPSGHTTAVLSHEVEYRIIKFDLVKVVILNAVYLAVILFLYFGNQKSHFVDHWFARILKF